jgi:hypothetical protein
MPKPMPLLILALLGCRESRFDETVELDVSLATRFVSDLQKGDVSYRGLGGDVARVRVSSWGRASRRATAERNQLGNAWEVDVSGNDLIATSSSTYVRAGVDMTVDGPDLFDVQATTRNGSVFVEDVLGSHVLEGDFVDTRRLEGEAQIRAGSLGVNAEIWPYEDGDVFIDSAGSVTLALPAFGPYDIRIVGQVSESLTLVDLGFDEVVLGEGFAEAWRHPRTTRIEVFTSGTFELAESR